MLTYSDIVIRLFLSALLGSIIGIERERLDWVAGLRTHMLVAVGATMFMLVSSYGFSGVLGHSIVLDPSRIAAQVVSGIGFLGAGTILCSKEGIRGLTTAASLWTVAAIGLAVGGGLYVAATCATCVVLVILLGIKPLEKRLFAGKRSHRISLLIDNKKISLQAIEQTIEKLGLEKRLVLIRPSDNVVGEERIQITLKREKNEKINEMARELAELSGVMEISIEGF